MCIIIQRNAGVEIDFETQFKPSVINNPHGFGISLVEGEGSLFTLRELSEEPDPDVLYKLVQEEYKDEKIMLHLRYNTAGETSMRNLHPFPILERGVDGVDMRMAHNGTIHKYKHNLQNKEMQWESDTRNFVRSYVRPLFKRLIKGMEPEELLTDPFVMSLLDDILPNTSVLAFIDGFGNTCEVNALGNGGEYFEEGWWCSNKYSFDAKHREPKTYNTGYNSCQSGNQVYQQDGDGRWKWMDARVNPPGKGSTSTTTSTTASSTDGKGTPPNTQSANREKDSHAMDTKTELFSKKYEEWVGKFEDLFNLSDATLETMKEKHPDELLLLTKELMFRCQGMNTALKMKDRQHEREIEEAKAAKADEERGEKDGKVA